jgi:hypothetical protein
VVTVPSSERRDPLEFVPQRNDVIDGDGFRNLTRMLKSPLVDERDGPRRERERMDVGEDAAS